MERTVEHDNYMCQKNLVLEPFKYKKGNIFRGKVLEKNDLTLSDSVSKRAVRERYTLLSEKFKAKMKDEERASGIECDLSEVVKTSEKEAAAEDTVENDKKVDNAKAAEMKNRAQESLSGTQKRKRYEERRMWNQGKKVVEVKVTQSHICAKKLI